MFGPTRYIEWARRFYGNVRFDLATSGIASVHASTFDRLPCPDVADADAWECLREAIATYNDTPAGEVMAALGTTHALWLALSALTSPGDVVLVEEPAYEPLIRIAEGVGAQVTRFTRPSQCGFEIDPERIARAMTARTRVVALSNLHNPTGRPTDDARLRAAAQVAAAAGAALLVDEVYSPFDALVDDSGVFQTSARKVAPNVVAVSSLTKCYGLGAERIGWLLGPADVIARARDAMTSNAGGLPLCHARQGLRAFQNIRPLADRSRGLLGKKRERVARWAGALGLQWSAPEEGLFGLVTLAGEGDLTASIEAAAREREVLVAAGAFFGVPNGFRIAWSVPDAALEEGLVRLVEALNIPRR